MTRRHLCNHWLRTLFSCLLMFICVGSPLCVDASQTSQKYHTIAHAILEVETDVLGTTLDFSLLDQLLDEARARINVQPPYSQKKALHILQEISELLHQQHIQVGDALLLSQTCTLQPGETPLYPADCDSFSFLYLAIAGVLDLPLQLISLPEHTFIRWPFADGTSINWETTSDSVWSDQQYLDWYAATHVAPISMQDFINVNREDMFFLVHYNLGNVLTRQGRYDEALTQYTESLAINPNYTNTYYQRGQIWHLLGNYDRAIEDFSQVLVLNPLDVDALHNRGSAWNDNGEYEQAITDFSGVLERQPQNVDARYKRGTAWFAVGEIDRALEDFDHALALKPHDVGTLLFRGRVWNFTGAYEQAWTDFTRAVELDPWSAEVYNSLAWFLSTCPEDKYRNGEQAVAYAQRALALQPGLRVVYLDTLAAAYAEMGEFQEAVVTQENAIQLLEAPENSEIVAGYRQRLELYSTQIPYRETGTSPP